ncbi:hemin uptake protein HemP [Citrobacter amalonaticus]|uniref:hemin uptake protein HemP n=1 Tax=Citrobacter sp. MGH 55 TaxID=1439319 RepID=UPI001C0A6B98|nr:hemin uptake protein HemP [Citrobacter sp. MGH 55]
MDNIESPRLKERENAALTPAPIRKISSQKLLGDEGKVIIDHNGQEYLLRQTQAGKLLLTK